MGRQVAWSLPRSGWCQPPNSRARSDWYMPRLIRALRRGPARAANRRRGPTARRTRPTMGLPTRNRSRPAGPHLRRTPGRSSGSPKNGSNLILFALLAGSCLHPALRAGRHVRSRGLCGDPELRSAVATWALLIASGRAASHIVPSRPQGLVGQGQQSVGTGRPVRPARRADSRLYCFSSWTLPWRVGLRWPWLHGCATRAAGSPGNAACVDERASPRHCLMCESDLEPEEPRFSCRRSDNLGKCDWGGPEHGDRRSYRESRAPNRVSVPARARLPADSPRSTDPHCRSAFRACPARPLLPRRVNDDLVEFFEPLQPMGDR